MKRVNEFVLLDTVQYTRRDWRNRNRLKSPDGARWLTIPVNVKGRYLQSIEETTVSDLSWPERHWETLTAWYRDAPFFEHYRPTLEGLYRKCEETHLSRINRLFLETMRDIMGISTPLTSAVDYPSNGEKTERLVEICRQAGATHYISGPSARAYLDVARFAAHGIAVSWMSYEGYPEYKQLHPPFDHYVSALDLLLNVGPEIDRYMLSQ